MWLTLLAVLALVSRRSTGEEDLHALVRANDAAALEKALKFADVEVKDKNGDSALHLSAALGHTGVMRVLLEAGASTAARTSEGGDSALHLAAALDRHDAVRLLLDNDGLQIDAPNNDGSSPLHSAIVHGQASRVTEVLVAAGASLESTTGQGYTPLHMAAILGKDDEAAALVAKGADVNRSVADGFSYAGQAALHFAAHHAHATLVERLLAAHADIHARDAVGGTPLHRAAMHPNKRGAPVAKMLIRAGSDVNGAALDGGTPLHVAVASDARETLDVLLEAGADVSSVMPDGKLTVLHVCAQLHRPVAATRLLELSSVKAKVDALNADGRTALSLAAYYPNSTGLVKSLLAAGARVNMLGKRTTADADGESALHRAVRGNATETLAALLAAGARTTVRAADGRTPLLLAAMLCRHAAAEALLRAGADTEAEAADPTEDRSALRALHHALMSGHAEAPTMVALLLRHGADPSVMGGGGGAGASSLHMLALRQKDKASFALLCASERRLCAEAEATTDHMMLFDEDHSSFEVEKAEGQRSESAPHVGGASATRDEL